MPSASLRKKNSVSIGDGSAGTCCSAMNQLISGIFGTRQDAEDAVTAAPASACHFSAAKHISISDASDDPSVPPPTLDAKVPETTTASSLLITETNLQAASKH
ncbi:hypothetical protein NDU88_000659, partial [Pleurodeles waltl]